MNWQRFISVPVFAVLSVTGFMHYITVFVFIRDRFGLQTSTGFWNALIISLLVCLCFFSFLVSVLTDPGHVPPSYVPDVEDSVGSDQELKKPAAQVRQCDKCLIYKPPRAHHCKVCRRCVLRMDHHCLWINNCVGYWNYKAFFMLVFYATTGSIYSTVIIISSAFQRDWDFSGRTQLKLFYVCSGVVVAALSLILGTLLGWHIYLITRNMTTIEEYEHHGWLRNQGRSINIHLILVPTKTLF